MKILQSLLLVSALLMTSCSFTQEEKNHDHGLEISEIEPDKKTILVKQNLHHLLKVYDLAPFLYTKNIVISEEPGTSNLQKLTLDTKFADRPDKLLAQFLHAQLHAWSLLTLNRFREAVKDLKKIYPQAPTEVRNGNKIEGQAHLIICYLERLALDMYLGEKQSREIILEFIKSDKIYSWAYSQVLNKNSALKQVLEKHKLLPSPLN